MGCPGNSTTWTASLDPSSHNVTCTLVGCAAGTVLCGDYCIATPTILTGATCTAASAVSHMRPAPHASAVSRAAGHLTWPSLL